MSRARRSDSEGRSLSSWLLTVTPERLAVGEQADLLDPSPVAVDAAADRVAHLVRGDDRALPLVHRAAAAGPDRHLEPALLEVGHLDLVAGPAGGEDRRLVEHVGELGTREPVRLAGEDREVDRLGEWLVARVDGQDVVATADVRQPDVDLAVEPAGPEDGGVEDIEPVRGRHHDDVVGGREPVELDEQLVEGRLALLVPVGAATGLGQRVELVDEDHRPAERPGLREQVADPARPDAHVLLDELRARDVEERDPCLGRDGAGEHRLAGAGRAVEEDAARDRRPEAHEPLGLAQEVDDLGQLVLRLVAACDVLEPDVRCAGATRHARTRRAGARRVDDGERGPPAATREAGDAGDAAAQESPDEDADRDDEHGRQDDAHDRSHGVGRRSEPRGCLGAGPGLGGQRVLVAERREGTGGLGGVHAQGDGDEGSGGRLRNHRGAWRAGLAGRRDSRDVARLEVSLEVEQRPCAGRREHRTGGGRGHRLREQEAKNERGDGHRGAGDDQRARRRPGHGAAEPGTTQGHGGAHWGSGCVLVRTSTSRSLRARSRPGHPTNW